MKFKILCPFCSHDDFEYSIRDEKLVCEMCGEETEVNEIGLKTLDEE